MANTQFAAQLANPNLPNQLVNTGRNSTDTPQFTKPTSKHIVQWYWRTLLIASFGVYCFAESLANSLLTFFWRTPVCRNTDEPSLARSKFLDPNSRCYNQARIYHARIDLLLGVICIQWDDLEAEPQGPCHICN